MVNTANTVNATITVSTANTAITVDTANIANSAKTANRVESFFLTNTAKIYELDGSNGMALLQFGQSLVVFRLEGSFIKNSNDIDNKLGS